MTQQMTKRLAQTLQGFDFLDRQPEKNLACWVGLLLLLLMQTLALAEETADFDQYDPDVAALLTEYRAESDESGSLLPSVLAYRGQSKAETLIDFERGLINHNRRRPERDQASGD